MSNVCAISLTHFLRVALLNVSNGPFSYSSCAHCMDTDLKSDSKRFTWPPPDDELNALEQLFISDDDGPLCTRHAAPMLSALAS